MCWERSHLSYWELLPRIIEHLFEGTLGVLKESPDSWHLSKATDAINLPKSNKAYMINNIYWYFDQVWKDCRIGGVKLIPNQKETWVFLQILGKIYTKIQGFHERLFQKSQLVQLKLEGFRWTTPYSNLNKVYCQSNWTQSLPRSAINQDRLTSKQESR